MTMQPMKQMPLQRIYKSVLHFLYPNRCPVCGKLLSAYELLCEPCAESVLLEQDSYCHQCGKVNCMCRYRNIAYDKAVVACRYDDKSAPAVTKLKASENTNFAYFSAEILAERLKSEEYGRINAVMPVPMHWTKRRMRGYNQAALIAAEIARRLSLPYREDVLYKRKSEEQHRLNAQQRVKNAESFRMRKNASLQGMHILLCDDVLTTGNTLNRCAELVKQAGAAFVIVASASTTVSRKSEMKEPDNANIASQPDKTNSACIMQHTNR